MSKKLIKPTEAELEILQVLWEHGPSSVRDVHEILAARRETGYTTTLKLMQIMLDKGLVRRNAEARTHIYEAGVHEAEVQSQLLRRFVDSTFRGSASQLVLQALGNHKASKKELEQIKALIEKIEKNDKS
jgi:predicted transcriptional regulator